MTNTTSTAFSINTTSNTMTIPTNTASTGSADNRLFTHHPRLPRLALPGRSAIRSKPEHSEGNTRGSPGRQPGGNIASNDVPKNTTSTVAARSATGRPLRDPGSHDFARRICAALPGSEVLRARAPRPHGRGYSGCRAAGPLGRLNYSAREEAPGCALTRNSSWSANQAMHAAD